MAASRSVRAATLAFLREHKSMVIATASPSGEMQASTVFFYVDNDFNFYFVTGKESRKAQHLLKNSQVAFVVGFGPAPVTAQGGGKARPVARTPSVFFKMVDRLNEGDPIKTWPLVEINREGFIAFKIKPKWLTWLNADKENRPETYLKEHHKII